MATVTIHVIPVPRGYTAEDAWWEIQTFGKLRRRWWQVFLRPTWVVIEEDD